MATDGLTPAGPGGPSRRRPNTRRIVGWSIAFVVLILLIIVAWVSIRGLMAKRELDSAAPYVRTVQASITTGDTAAAATAAEHLRGHAAQAASLTGDPVWRVVEIVPGIGQNLSAVRTAAAATDTLATRVIAPLVSVAKDADPSRIKPVNGAIDLTPLERAQPVVERAQIAFHEAEASVDGIDVDATIGPVHDAVKHLRGMLENAAPAVDAVGNSARLLPAMLGADGQRSYLLLAQNPAELRATGGLIGALALIRADHGKISLISQASGSSFRPLAQPIAVVPASSTGLYGPFLANAIQAVNLTPDFPLAAKNVSALWTAKFGGKIDGVLTIDPVALSYLLKATGPVPLSTGDMLSASNAVQLLLSDVYRRWSDPAQQDAFFASAAGSVFSAVASGSADGTELVKALAQAGGDHRMLIWSAHAAEEKVLASTTLAGRLPESDPSTAGIGVYFNDATGAKMDYYLTASVAAGTALCRTDGTPSTQVRVTLANNAPADAATTLPAYVTGNGYFGLAPGNIRTRVAVYGPEGGLLTATRSGDVNYPTIAGTDDQRPVSVFTVDLAPGQSKTVTVDLLNMKQTETGMSLTITPTLHAARTTASTPGMGGASVIALDCGDTVK
ncbi:DUF4012 domain-containing protein [Leifsonia poae]|uniref:DUF4012 domain-containing protein n=1 Tax=Leifsonia poae TaxID=110933 RepID=A0A9W6HA73_9MICO|nr:DUF4012 domain-containing protein [Leifsonia poae]GLJ76776.1 hypothetical protein GCM10017584_23500 [Leifsonia poae]